MLLCGPAADNFGRRFTLLIGLAIGVLGQVLVQLASNLETAEAGMFVVGMSVQSCYNLVICILSEVLENGQRQKKTILVNAFFTIAGFGAVGSFYILQSWRPVFIFLQLIPFIASLIFAYFFVQETPQFLIKINSVQEILDSLHFIAKINKT